MRRRDRSIVFLVCVLGVVSHVLLLAPRAAAQAAALRVVSAGPAGEVSSLQQANEIRVVFSEPMVALGRIPEPVNAPFFRVRPAVRGTFRWSGTTILVFTPDPDRPLPYATTYEVTIDAAATAISGRTLGTPYRFRFTTPTVRLLNTNWIRRSDRFDRPVQVFLRFNQPVNAAAMLPHIEVRHEAHDFAAPSIPPAGVDRLKQTDPDGLRNFERKAARARAAAANEAPVPVVLSKTWDFKQYPRAADLIVFETTIVPEPESWLRVTIGPRAPSPQGRAVPGIEQHYTIQLPRALFVDGFRCQLACDPDTWNPAALRARVSAAAWGAALTATDVTAAAPETPVKGGTPKLKAFEFDAGMYLTLEDAGFEQPPARTWLVRVDPSLAAADGQTLGYPWIGTIENWHHSAFTSFGDGHGVWESSGGLTLPFYARNLTEVRQWALKIEPADLMDTILRLQPKDFRLVPPGDGAPRKLPVTADRIQSHGIDLSGALGAAKTGLVWAAVREGAPIARSRPAVANRQLSTIVQVTNLGITIKDSPENTLIFVTRLDNGEPVPGANVSIVNTEKAIFWQGITGPDGVAIAPDTRLRNRREWWQFAFIVTAEKDGDVAYAANDWNEGLSPWEFGLRYDLEEADPLLRGSVFSDRGVYRLGEEIHFKTILRRDTPRGVQLLEPGTTVFALVSDGEGREIDRRPVKANDWSSAEWTLTLPKRGSLGTYSVAVSLQEPPKSAPAGGRFEGGLDEVEGQYDRSSYETVANSFLVAAYRRPEFRVDVTLAGAPAIAGGTLSGVVAARYLFGAPMSGAATRYRLYRERNYSVPPSIAEKYPLDRFAFTDCCDILREDVRAEDVDLDPDGTVEIDEKTPLDLGAPYRYTLEGDVEDVSRQHIAGRASFIVHPAPWYIGVKRPPYFVDQKTGVSTEIVAVTPEGEAVAGVIVEVALTRTQYHSVRRAIGNGFYTWETTREEVSAGSWTVTTAADPAPLAIPLPAGGSFTLTARTSDAEGRSTRTRLNFYSVGAGYTAWTRYDHNRIDLVPERTSYSPGETARIMVQSPWEQATALVTTEREGVRSHRQFALTSTQQTISVPIAESDIPNVYVSVLLVKGRTKADGENDASDPGKPSFRVGYAELKVEDAGKRLSVSVKANREEYRPANTASVEVRVSDAAGRPAPSEVTLWAVDYGVLSLTAYRTPDVLSSVYVAKALQVMTEDSRQRIVSRRVLTPKGSSEGGGGGSETGASTVRRDFRVLAFWLGSVQTDASGRASAQIKLPESLTTYRIMAVSGDRQSRFGSGESEIRINKPLLLRAAFPRFLASGDRAHFGAAVTSQLARGGSATVTIQSLDPAVLTFAGDTKRTIELAAGGTQEVRFDAEARASGRARIRMTVRLGSEADAFEDSIPIEVLTPKETVAGYGEAAPEAKETVTVPPGVLSGVGGLQVSMASTAMVRLAEAARYVVDYPYGCVEQKASRALVMTYAADLGGTFALPGLAPDTLRPIVQDTVDELPEFQCPNGAFTFWKGHCPGNAYLTAYVLHVLHTADAFKYSIDANAVARAVAYLESEMAATPPRNEGWWPAYTAWQAFAANVLVRAGRNQDSNLARLYRYRERMPVFALAYLYDAMAAVDAGDARLTDLQRRITNAILSEGGMSHVEELADPYLLWFWNSNVRTTAIVLDTMSRRGVDEPAVRAMVQWLIQTRKNGRWNNTQENAWALAALVSYYRRYESGTPDFRATARLGRSELARNTFRGRSTEAVSAELPMAQLIKGGTAQDLTFRREGAGTLFYSTRLQYVTDAAGLQDMDKGIRVQRRYEKYVDGEAVAAGTSFAAGDLVRVTLTFDLPKERRYVAVTDPLPAGLEPIESWFATTAQELAEAQEQAESGGSWFDWWERGSFDHVERHDDRVQLFATRLAEGRHEFSYVTRATTTGTFVTAPAHAEEMYTPEVFGRTATVTIGVKR